MKVKLAVQTLSASVADALVFCGPHSVAALTHRCAHNPQPDE